MLEGPPPAIDRRGTIAACVAGVLAFAAYLATLAPGLTADVDSPMFQFIGKALGVAHNPGYPLYVLLTHPLAYVPIGSLAWRVNVFSAVMGGVAVALTCLAARGLGCRVLVSAAAALGFACGATFWSQAVIAEVYTLHAALVAGLLTAAFAWRTWRRPRLWYAAVACLAAGLGNHTTIAAFAPALALYGLLVDRPFVTRLRTIATSVGILALGLLPYALVLIRSRDPQAYVESRATTLAGLASVILGRQFQDRLFAENWTHALATRGAVIAERVFVADLTWPGLCLAALGAGWLLRLRPADALLPGVGGLIVTAFAVNYVIVDTPVFLLPALLGLWLFAAAGAEFGLRAADRAAVPGRGLLAIALLALPIALAVRHAPAVDRSADRQDAAHLDRLFDVLPDRSAIVGGDFIADRMVRYELLGREAAGGRDIRLAPRDAAALRGLHEAGVRLVAFPGAVDRLRFEGLDFSAAPVPLVDGTLDALAADLPRGSAVALAVPAAHARAFALTAPEVTSALSVAGLDHTVDTVVAGVLGDGRTTLAAQTPDGVTLRLPEARWDGPQVELVAKGTGAAIRWGGRDLVRTADGVAAVVWAPDGRLRRAFVLGARNHYQVPVERGTFSVHPLTGISAERTLAPGEWVDVTPLAATGSVALAVPRGGIFELRASDDAPLAPAIADSAGQAPVEARTYEVKAQASPADANVERPPEPLERARGSRPAAGVAPIDGPGWTSAIRIDAAGEPVSVFLTLGGIPHRVLGRLTSTGAEPARVRGVSTTGLLHGPDSRSVVVSMTRDDQARLIGAGWSAVEADAAGAYRWMTASDARLVLPAAGLAPRSLRLEAYLGDEGGPSAVAIVVNGVRLPARPTAGAWQAYEWEVPPPLAAALAAGPSELTIAVDRLGLPSTGGARRGLAVASLRLAD